MHSDTVWQLKIQTTYLQFTLNNWDLRFEIFPRCLSLYSVDSFWALICCCFVNYCLLYWFCWLISLIRLSAFLLLLSLFPGLWTLYWKRWPFQLRHMTSYWICWPAYGEALTMKNTQGVPCGRGKTAPESLPADFHITFCGPVWVCTSEGVFMPML